MIAKDNANRAVSSLVEYLRQLEAPKSAAIPGQIHRPNFPRVLFDERAKRLHSEAMEILAKSYALGSPPDLSPEHIKNCLDDTVLGALGLDGQGQNVRTKSFVDRLTRGLASLNERLGRAASEWSVYLPVQGPTLRRTRTFGGVTFFTPGAREPRLLAAEMKDPGTRFPVSKFTDGQVAKVHVVAKDGTAARLLGLHIVRGVLDALDFLGPTLEAPYLDLELSFEPVHDVGASAIVSKGQKYAAWQSHSFFPKLMPFETLEMKDPSLFRAINALLRKRELSTLQTRLATAVAWAGRSRVQRRPDQALLLNVIALESALTPDERAAAVTERVARRAALVVGGTYESRKRIFDEVRGLYVIRSQLVHAGCSSSVNEQNLDVANSHVRRVLQALLTRRPFSRMSEADLEDWFKKRELGV